MRHILYFTADWCNPCQRTKPFAEELIAEGDFTINRLDFGIGNNKDNQSKSIDQSVVIKFRIAGENLLF